MKFWQPSERTQRALIWVILPLVVYTLAAVFITWPLVTRLTTFAAGTGYSDSYEVIRHGWWTREALLNLDNPFDQPLLVYPEGFTSRVQLAQPIQYFAVAIPSLIFSPLTAFNLALIGTLILNGMAAYWLGLNLNGRLPLAALLGGLVFLAFPKMQGHLSVGHLSILSLYPLPLFVICLWRVLRESANWRTVIAGGICFALTVLASVSQITYVLMPLLIFGGLYSILFDRHHIIRRGVPLNEQPWFKGGVMLAFGTALVLPFYLPLFTTSGQAEISDIAETGRIRYSTDLLAFASPSPFGPLEAVVPDYTRDVLGENSTEGTAYLGVIALALAGLGVIRREEARLWLVVACGAMVLSLGALLKWRDDPVFYEIENIKSYVTLPWALFQRLPILDSTRTPGRFNITTGLALSAMVSLGASVLLNRIRWRAVRIELTAALMVLIILEYQLFWPFETMNATQPEYFRTLAEMDDVRAVLDVPVDHYRTNKLALYQQIFHEKPLIAGYAARRTTQDPALLTVLNRAIAPGSPDNKLPLQPRALPYLLSIVGADRLIVHKEAYENPGEVVDRLNAILGVPEYVDEQIAAYAVPRTSEPPPGFTLVGVAGSDGWLGPFEFSDKSFLTESGEWYFYTAQETYGDLVFPFESYGSVHQIGVWLDDHLIMGQGIAAGEFRVRLWLEPGFHTLRFESMNGCTDYSFPLVCMTSSQLGSDCTPLETPVCISAAFGTPTWHPLEAPPTPLDVTLDDGVRLRAYDLNVNPDSVDVRLFWSAEESLPQSYALFVHLVNPDTGEPLAQANGFPIFPTNEWDDGARWQSEAQIILPDDLPAGTYGVNVGWFNLADNTRLGVHGDRKWASEGIVHLDTVEIR